MRRGGARSGTRASQDCDMDSRQSGGPEQGMMSEWQVGRGDAPGARFAPRSAQAVWAKLLDWPRLGERHTDGPPTDHTTGAADRLSFERLLLTLRLLFVAVGVLPLLAFGLGAA